MNNTIQFPISDHLVYGHPLMEKLISEMNVYAELEYVDSEWAMQAEYILIDHDLPTSEHNIKTLVGWII